MIHKILSLKVILLIAIIVPSIHSANILGLLGVPSSNHYLWISNLVNLLTVENHNVTILSTYIPKESQQNLHFIPLEGIYEKNFNAADHNFDFLSKEEITSPEISLKVCKNLLESSGVNRLLEYPENFKFHLIFYDYSSGPCLLGFLHKFKYPPLIGYTPLNIPVETKQLVGGQHFPGNMNTKSYEFEVENNLLKRFQNTFMYLKNILYHNFVVVPSYDYLIKSAFNESIPSVKELEKKVILAMVNSHPSLYSLQGYYQNVIEVAGLDINNEQELPINLQEHLENFKQGTILVTLNPYKNFKQSHCKVIEKVFTSLLDYKFLWENGKICCPNIKFPRNVLVEQVLDLNDVLGYSTLKGIITNGNTRDIHTAIWHPTPMVIIPHTNEEFENTKLCTEAGVAIKLEMKGLNEEKLQNAIYTITKNEMFLNNIRTLSYDFRTRPTSPLKLANWWVEYILDEPIPKYLTHQPINLTWKSYSVDVIISAILIVFLWLYLTVRFLLLLVKVLRNIKGRKAFAKKKFV